MAFVGRAFAITLCSIVVALAAARDGSGDPTATGKVALEGTLATNNPTPAPGAVIMIYGNITPLVDVARLNTRLVVAAGINPVDGAPLSFEFNAVGAGTTVSFAVPVVVVEPGSQQIFAEAVAADDSSLVQARTFVLTLNENLSIESAPVQKGESATGRALIIYEN